MQLKELESLSTDQLRQQVERCFADASKVLTLEKSPYWAEAEVYLKELDRREERRYREARDKSDAARDEEEAKRWKKDLWYEQFIVVLIIFEILVSIVLFIIGGCEQSMQVRDQIAAVGKVKDELGKLETSSGETTNALKDVQHSLELMDKALERQLGIAYEPSIDIKPFRVVQHLWDLTAHNNGNSNVLVYGVSSGPHICRYPEPILITKGGEQRLGGRVIPPQLTHLIRTGTGADVFLFLRSEDQRDYQDRFNASAKSLGEGEGIDIYEYGIRPFNWESKLRNAQACYGAEGR